MKVLVIGSGGREHALVKSFCHSKSISEVHVIPGNDGMNREALCHKISWRDTEALVQFCLRTEIDFVFIGPEEPLVFGLADELRARGILVVGPSREAARLEGSKVFAKEFMLEAGVPTAPFALVHSVDEIRKQIHRFTPPFVLKADGLAAGKGVFICKTEEELFSAATELFEKKSLGSAGESALLEQFLPGWELSFLVLTNGKDFVSLPLAQDHKRLKDQDQGPNTGGMGTVAPLKISTELRLEIEEKIVQASVKKLSDKALVYRGVLFVGVMMTDKGPVVLEYNVRFGDPETQVILPLLDEDTGILFKSLAEGNLKKLALKNLSTCCVVMAAEGYPQVPVKGAPISGPVQASEASSYFIHAGTERKGSEWVTSGGRVLGAVGLGTDLNEAIKQAYQLVQQVEWPGVQFRKDIGQSLLQKQNKN